MEGAWIWALIPIIAVVGGMTSAIVAVINRARIRELEIRERIAMIERGMVPPPEVDPHGFDRAMDRLERAQVRGGGLFGSRAARHRRSGIILMGVGFGLMVLIGFTERSDFHDGLGVGGFLVIVGLAFFISSLFDPYPTPPSYPPPSVPPPPQPPTQPRQN